MREIKFRAWDKRNKCWHNRVNWKKPNMLTINTRGEVVGIYNLRDVEKGNSDTINIVDLSDQYEVVFYTGLKDKNGKEIYERDILEVDSQNMNTLTEEKLKAIVEWHPTEARFLLVYTKPNTAFLEIAGKSRKVIGNIYENPELLQIPY